MSRKLDSWAFYVAVSGFCLSLFLWVLSLGRLNSIFSTLQEFCGLITFSGLILGIIALSKGSGQKWKPILAIILFVLNIILNLVAFIVGMSLTGF